MNKKQIGTAIGLIASIIGIFSFMTGNQSLPALFQNQKNPQSISSISTEASNQDGQLIIDKPFSGDTTVYYVTNEYKYQVMEEAIDDAKISPDNRTIIGVGMSGVYITNIDGSNYHEYLLCKTNGCYEHRNLKNLTFISNNTVRLSVELISFDTYDMPLTIDGFPLNDGTGEYELTFDEYNSLVSVKRK